MENNNITSPERPLRTFLNSPLLVFLIILTLAAIGRTGLEKQAIYTPHDDFYFLHRSQFYDLNSHLSFIKEYPYSFFIKVGRQLGFNLWDFELIFYSLALTALWFQLRRFLRSSLAAWIVVFPLPFLPMLNLVFQRTTYDNLQLILTPLTFATALAVLNTRGSWGAVAAAGLVGGLHLATRPEGILFFIPVMVAAAIVVWWLLRDGECRGSLLGGVFRLGGRAAILVVTAALLPVAISLHNQHHHGFRAQTIMKAPSMQETLRLLMEIKPREDGGRYSPVPMDSLQQAREASPAFERAWPHFEAHTGGRGWSGGSVPPYKPLDGSISGGHFQWAWQEFSSLVAGMDPPSILAYQEQVAAELRAAFADGRLQSRRVWTTAFGPNFSLLEPAYWQSVWRLTRILLHREQTYIAGRAVETGIGSLEDDFNRLALRKVALVIRRDWSRQGWVLREAPLVGPSRLSLDDAAKEQGARLEVKNRPDVALFMQGKQQAYEQQNHPYGFMLHGSSTQLNGNLLVHFDDEIARVPLRFLFGANPHRTWSYEGLMIQLEAGMGGAFSREARRNYNIMQTVREQTHVIGRWAMLLLPGLLVVGLIAGRPWNQPDSAGNQLLAFSAMVLLFAGAFVAVLGAIDAFMYPGDEPRYLAPVSFALWLWAAFVPVRLAQRILP